MPPMPANHPKIPPRYPQAQYQPSTARGHYKGGTYNWSSQTQNNGLASEEAHSHRSGAWHEMNSTHSQPPVFDLHGQQTDHRTLGISPGDGQDYYGPTSPVTALEKQEGLNSPAYA